MLFDYLINVINDCSAIYDLQRLFVYDIFNKC